MKKILLFLITIVLISCETKENKIEQAITLKLSQDFPVSKSNPMGAINLQIDKQEGGILYCSYDLIRQDSMGFFYSTKGTAVVKEYEVIRYDFEK